jgi:hypothetical protein
VNGVQICLTQSSCTLEEGCHNRAQPGIGRRDEEEKKERQGSEIADRIEEVEGQGEAEEGHGHGGSRRRQVFEEQFVPLEVLAEPELVLEPVSVEFEPLVEQLVALEFVVLQQLFLVVQPRIEFIFEQSVRAGPA